MFNPRRKMKAKREKDWDYNENWLALWNVRLSMFEYKNLPETLRPEVIETLLATHGTCGVTEINGELYTGEGGYCGNVVNFIPTDYQITVVGVPGGDGVRGKVGEKFAVGWNNMSATPDFMIEKYADILTELDVSERVVTQYTRLLRIPKVKDQKEKVAVEGAVKAISEGKFEAVTSSNVMVDELIGNERAEKFLDLVNPQQIDSLQYLNQYYDNVQKRFFQYYGQGMSTTGKLAQVSTDELHGSDAVSMIIPLQMLEKRKQWVDEINRIFGTNITVDFSECWRDSREEMNELYSSGEVDETPTDERSEENGEDESNEAESDS